VRELYRCLKRATVNPEAQAAMVALLNLQLQRLKPQYLRNPSWFGGVWPSGHTPTV